MPPRATFSPSSSTTARFFLARWQKLLLATLTLPKPSPKNHPAPTCSASPASAGRPREHTDSVSYRLVRAFRLARRAACVHTHFRAVRRRLSRFWIPTASILSPRCGLCSRKSRRTCSILSFSRWDDLLLAAADAVMDDLYRQGVPPEQADSGPQKHRSHPASVQPLPARPARPLARPARRRVARRCRNAPRRGASRLARASVSSFRLGHGEDEGIFRTCPAAKADHPLSPFYRAGHEAPGAWRPHAVPAGKPRKHTLELNP